VFRTILIVNLYALTVCLAWAGPDPMRPPVLPETTPSVQEDVEPTHWQLNLIRRSGEERVALLNGRLLKVGGSIDGARVTAIEEHKVTLQLTDDRSIELTLPSIEIRHTKD
jgi:hypothetical protein